MLNSMLSKLSQAHHHAEFMIFLLCLALYFAWYAWRHQRGFLMLLLMTLPILLLLIIRAMDPMSSRVLLVGAVIAFSIFAIAVSFIDSRRRALDSIQLVTLTDAVATLTVLCIVFPMVIFGLFRVGDSVVSVAILGVASLVLTGYTRSLVIKHRPDIPHRFQVPLKVLLLATTLLAVGFVSLFVMAISIFFFGAGMFYGGVSLVPAPRGYQWEGVSRFHARQQRTGIVALLNGIAVMLLGLANACVANSI